MFRIKTALLVGLLLVALCSSVQGAVQPESPSLQSFGSFLAISSDSHLQQNWQKYLAQPFNTIRRHLLKGNFELAGKSIADVDRMVIRYKKNFPRKLERLNWLVQDLKSALSQKSTESSYILKEIYKHMDL